MEKCVFPAKNGELNRARATQRKPWTLALSSIFVLTSLLGIPPANAGPHYVDLPAYRDRFLLNQHAPPQASDVFLQIGPAEKKSRFLLYRPTLCRIEFLNHLLCSTFQESKTPVVSITEDIVEKKEFLHLIDLAYLDRIEVRQTQEERQTDLEGLIELARSAHFKKMRNSDPAEVQFTQAIHSKIFDWIQKETFSPQLSDLTFLSVFFLITYDRTNLDNATPDERVWLLSKKDWLLNKIGQLAISRDLSNRDEAALLAEIRTHSKDEGLRKTIEKRLRSLPKDHLSKGMLFRKFVSEEVDED